MTRVLICGLVTSACVLGTALGAFYRGLDVLLVEDCCADRSIERHEATVGMYSDYCFQSILARDFLGASHEDTLNSTFNLAGLLKAWRVAGCRLSSPSLSLGQPPPSPPPKAKGDIAGAEPLYREVLQVLRSTVGSRHPHALNAMQGLQPPRSHAVCVWRQTFEAVWALP